MGNLERLDGHLVPGGVEARARPLGRPAVVEGPPLLLLAGVVHEDDRAVLPLDLAVDGLLAPLPERGVVGGAPLERDVGVLVQPRQLAGGERLLVTLAVLDGVLRRIQARRLAESAAIDALDFQPEIKSSVRINPVPCRHAPLLPGPYMVPSTRHWPAGAAVKLPAATRVTRITM